MGRVRQTHAQHRLTPSMHSSSTHKHTTQTNAPSFGLTVVRTAQRTPHTVHIALCCPRQPKLTGNVDLLANAITLKWNPHPQDFVGRQHAQQIVCPQTCTMEQQMPRRLEVGKARIRCTSCFGSQSSPIKWPKSVFLTRVNWGRTVSVMRTQLSLANTPADPT